MQARTGPAPPRLSKRLLSDAWRLKPSSGPSGDHAAPSTLAVGWTSLDAEDNSQPPNGLRLSGARKGVRWSRGLGRGLPVNLKESLRRQALGFRSSEGVLPNEKPRGVPPWFQRAKVNALPGE